MLLELSLSPLSRESVASLKMATCVNEGKFLGKLIKIYMYILLISTNNGKAYVGFSSRTLVDCIRYDFFVKQNNKRECETR